MNDWMTTSLTLLAEAAIVFGAVIIFYLVYNLRRKRHDRAIIVKLVKRLKEKEAARKENLKKLLGDCCGREEKEAAEIMETLSGREKTLYCNVIDVFLGRDRGKIKRLDEDVQALVRAYQKLVLEGADGEEEGGGHNPSQLSYTALRKDNEALNAANEALRKELSDSKKAMDNMMKEYATMYAGGQQESEFEVRDQMQQLRGKDWVGETSDAEEDPGAGAANKDEEDLFDQETEEIPELLEGVDEVKNPTS